MPVKADAKHVKDFTLEPVSSCPDRDRTGNAVAVGDAGTVAAYSASFADIALATIDASTAPDGGPYFVGGEGYTFVVVGDPTAPLDSGLQPHFIAFPYHPVLPTYP